MEKSEVIERIKKMIGSTMRVDKHLLEKVDENTKFVQDLGMNSVDALQLLVMIEVEFSIIIEDEELNSGLVDNMGNLSKFILEKISQCA